MHAEASPSIGGDGHLCGNFHNYYNFHPPEQRTSFIPASHFVDLWRSLGQPTRLLLLDVGCNEGNLSIQLQRLASTDLQEHSCQVQLLGVDIDPELIERARAKSDDASIQFLVADVMSSSGRAALREYLDSNSSSTFDFVSLFSITMWIHINFGNDVRIRYD
jgi:SAM-dependent methyltransferase